MDGTPYELTAVDVDQQAGLVTMKLWTGKSLGDKRTQIAEAHLSPRDAIGIAQALMMKADQATAAR